MLELYYSETCPYCRKVLDYFSEKGIDFDARDVGERRNYDRVMELGHMAQVPFLVDTSNNIHMYESDKIIDYVKNLNM